MALMREIGEYIDRIYVLTQVLGFVNPSDMEETTLATYASVIMNQAEQLRTAVEKLDEVFILKLKQEREHLSKNITEM